MSTNRLLNEFNKREPEQADVVPPLGETNLAGTELDLYYVADAANMKKAKSEQSPFLHDMFYIDESEVSGDFNITIEDFKPVLPVVQSQPSQQVEKVAVLLADAEKSVEQDNSAHQQRKQKLAMLCERRVAALLNEIDAANTLAARAQRQLATILADIERQNNVNAEQSRRFKK